MAAAGEKLNKYTTILFSMSCKGQPKPPAADLVCVLHCTALHQALRQLASWLAGFSPQMHHCLAPAHGYAKGGVVAHETKQLIYHISQLASLYKICLLLVLAVALLHTAV